MTERKIHFTGVLLTDEEYQSIKQPMEPTIGMDFKTNITIKGIASDHGLPNLKKTFTYGLAGREIVCFQEAIMKNSDA